METQYKGRSIDLKSALAVFKALADPTRLRIIRLLALKRTEMCVCEFVDILLERQYNISRHLKNLETVGLIQGKKDGRWAYYGLAAVDDPVALHLYELVVALPDNNGVFARDDENLEARMALRENGRCRVGIQSAELGG